MPTGYEKMVREFERDGLSHDQAQSKAARIWNKKHPNNPVGKKHKK
jgi:hypothetical protein